MSDRERIQYILLSTKLNVPGYMGSNRLNVSPSILHAPGSYRDAVADAWKEPDGSYRFVVPSGPHKGEFEVPAGVGHAKYITEHDSILVAGERVHAGRERHCAICHPPAPQAAPQPTEPNDIPTEPDATPE